MPSQRSYQVNNVESNQVAEEDQSYRSCLLALIIFFFLCMILILVSLPWKKSHFSHPKHQGEQVGTAQHHHHEHHEEEITTTTRRSVTTVVTLSEPKETIFETEASTQDYNTVDSTNEATNSSKFEKILSIETTTEEEVSTASVIDNKFITDYDNRSMIGTNSIEGVTSTTEQTEGTTADEPEVHTTQPSTPASSNSTNLNFTFENTSSEAYKTTTDNIIEVTTKNEDSTIETTSENRQDTLTHSTTLNSVKDDTTSVPLTTTIASLVDENVCTTGECKNMASKMLFYMNHTIDPCEDFYEYACGGFETSPQTVEQDAAYQRILRVYKIK